MITRFLPVPASAHASMLDAVLIDVHWHMLAVFLTWLVIFFTALVRFREGRQAPTRMRPGPVCCGRRWRLPPWSSATSSCWRPALSPPGTPG